MHGCRCILFAVAVVLTFGCTTVPSDDFSATPSLLRGNPPEVREHVFRLRHGSRSPAFG